MAFPQGKLAIRRRQLGNGDCQDPALDRDSINWYMRRDAHCGVQASGYNPAYLPSVQFDVNR